MRITEGLERVEIHEIRGSRILIEEFLDPGIIISRCSFREDTLANVTLEYFLVIGCCSFTEFGFKSVRKPSRALQDLS